MTAIQLYICVYKCKYVRRYMWGELAYPPYHLQLSTVQDLGSDLSVIDADQLIFLIRSSIDGSSVTVGFFCSKPDGLGTNG